MGVKTYEQTMRQIEDPKVSEARVISAVTNGLERHKAEGRTSANLKDYLAKNQRLWGVLRNNAASSENMLPTNLKASIVSIALWIDRHTAKVLTGEGDVDDIIAVNRSLIAGLNGQAGA